MDRETKVRVGTSIKTDKNIEVESLINGRKHVIPLGTEGIVGADNHLHYSDGSVLKIDMKVDGYDKYGMAKVITNMLLKNLDGMADYIVDYDMEREDVENIVVDGLDVMGF